MNDDEEENENPLNGYWLEGDSLAPPCQAEMDVVESIIKLAETDKNSYLFDLGCGDGRICIQASKMYGCRSLGCEIEDNLIEKFKLSCEHYHLEDKVKIVHGDLLNLDFSDATIITIYLLPEAIEILKPKLIEALKRGCVIVCNTWGPKPLKPVARFACGFCNNVTLLKYDISSLN